MNAIRAGKTDGSSLLLVSGTLRRELIKDKLMELAGF